MHELDVVYLYENVAREMDVACAIKAILTQKHGMSAAIVQWPQADRRLYGKVKPRVVVLPFCYFEHSFDCLLEWRHSIFVNLAWEQLFYSGNVRAKTPRGDFAIKHVLHHAWSEGYARFARQQGIPEGHLFVNGQPAYSLYDEPYRRYYATREELAKRHGLDPSKRWVFFPENYNWAFYSDVFLKAFVTRGQAPAEIQEMREFCTRSFEVVMRWFADLARTPSVQLIIRPRPATSLADFRAAVARVVPDLPESMRVIQDETVREWIMASDLVLSSHSTSLIEAAVAGRPGFMVTPFPVPAALAQEWHALVPHLVTADQLRAAVLGEVDEQEHAVLASWARTTFMSHGDSIENLADHIARVVRGEVARPPVPSRLTATAQGDTYAVPKWVWFVFRRLRARFRRIVPDRRDLTKLKEFVGPDELDRRVERWAALLRDHGRGSASRPPARAHLDRGVAPVESRARAASGKG